MSYEEHNDEQLLMLITQRKREALEALYDRYSGAVYSLAMHLLRDSGASEEVTQDVFFNVWRRSESYRSHRGSLKAWLFSIAHHRTIDELRRRKRQQTQLQYGVDLTRLESRPIPGRPWEYRFYADLRGASAGDQSAAIEALGRVADEVHVFGQYREEPQAT